MPVALFDSVDPSRRARKQISNPRNFMSESAGKVRS